MRSRFRAWLTTGLPVAIAVLALAQPAAAQYTWTGMSTPANGNWSDSTNWSSPPVSGIDSMLTFGASPVTSPNNNITGAFTLNQLTFDSGAPVYSLSGNTLLFSDGSTGNIPRITVNSDNRVTINNAVTVAGNTLGVYGIGSGSLEIPGGVSGSGLSSSGGSLVKFSLGSLTLGGTNSIYNCQLSAGTLTITNGASLSSSSGTVGTSYSGVTVNIGGGTGTSTWTCSQSLDVGSQTTDSMTITGGGVVSSTLSYIGSGPGFIGMVNVGGGTGAATWNAGALSVGLSGTGTLTINSGGTVVASSLNGGNVTSSVNFNGGTLSITASDNASNTLMLQAGGGTIQVPNAGTTFTVTGVVSDFSSGAGGLTKTGVGTLILTAANTYTGGTTITGGTLLVTNTSGSGTGSGAVTVRSGGTLSGGGTTVGSAGIISGLVTVQSGGHIAPGNSGPGILNLTGGVTFNTGSNLDIILNSASLGSGYDQLKVTGTAALNGTLNVTLGFTPSPTDTFTVVSATIVTGAFANTPGNHLTVSGGRFDVVYGANFVTLQNYTPVPEPASALLIGAGAAGVAVWLRRR
jgi:autotransporter-associated beta strand protein/T5SS/PEP-CTERM-associated repeat protein